MLIQSPTFPLTATAFEAALRGGHGRALQQVEHHGVNGLEDKLIEACVSCLTYDPQCEAERAPWVFSMVDRAKLNVQVEQAIEVCMQEAPSSKDHRDLAQRSALLKELAAAGSQNARRLLYASLDRLPETADVVGADHIVALDGVEGMIHVARQLGRWLREDPDFWVDDYYLTAQLDESTGLRAAGLAALEREAQTDPDVAHCLAGLRRTREIQNSHPGRVDPATYTGAEIVALVSRHPKDPCHWLRRWGAQAADDQRALVFEALLASEDPERVQRLFRCFGKTGVPRFDSRLLRWMFHPDTQVQWAAVRAMATIRHGEVRQAALQMVADGPLANGMALLVNNAEAGDLALCTRNLAVPEDAEEAHHLLAELLDLCEANPGAEALDGLLQVYEFSPCSHCRRRAVKALTDARIAPAWVLAESAFDADPDTRELAHTHSFLDTPAAS